MFLADVPNSITRIKSSLRSGNLLKKDERLFLEEISSYEKSERAYGIHGRDPYMNKISVCAREILGVNRTLTLAVSIILLAEEYFRNPRVYRLDTAV